MTSARITNLTKDFSVRKGLGRQPFRAVDRVSFELLPGRTVALVGESGFGQVDDRPDAGAARETDLRAASRWPSTTSRRLWARCTAVTFRWCSRTRSPRSTHSIRSSTTSHVRCASTTARPARALRTSACSQMLDRVNLTPAEAFADRRPHELSGGQRQRVAIARALAPGAQVLIADEPVSMLDVSIRLGVLNLIGRLQREDNLAVLYITHDLATARHFSDEILVLYKGRVVERGPADAVILDPHHDYTRLLAAAAPDPERLGKVVSDEAVVDRSKLDNSVCYDHYRGAVGLHRRGGVGRRRLTDRYRVRE